MINIFKLFNNIYEDNFNLENWFKFDYSLYKSKYNLNKILYIIYVIKYVAIIK